MLPHAIFSDLRQLPLVSMGPINVTPTPPSSPTITQLGLKLERSPSCHQVVIELSLKRPLLCTMLESVARLVQSAALEQFKARQSFQLSINDLEGDILWYIFLVQDLDHFSCAQLY